MKETILIGIFLVLFIPPIVSIILGGANIGKNDDIGKFLDKDSDKDT